MENPPKPTMSPYRFSNEELRVLHECNSESFFQRSLPFSTFLGVGTYMSVKTGLLSPNIKYGAVPKVVAAVVLGYFLGKISYQEKCMEKLMALPDSKIAAMLREKRKIGGSCQDSLSLDDTELGKMFTDNPPPDSASSPPRPSSHMDLEIDRPLISLDDTYTPPLDNDMRALDDSINNPIPSRITSYDELRRQNREAYDMSRSKYSRGPVKSDTFHQDQFNETRQDPTPQIDEPRRPTRTNAYGDSWEK